MLVGSINHNSMDGSEELLKKLDYSLKILHDNNIIADLIVAPSSGLIVPKATHNHRPNNTTERYDLIQRLKEFSGQNPGTYILPGSMFWFDYSNQDKVFRTHASAPLFLDGKLEKEFYKERINGETWAAEQFAKYHNKNVIHKSGNNKDNYFMLGDQLVSVELCGDHGNQLSKRPDYEIILAYDTKGGFYITAANDSWSRGALLCNGYYASSMAWNYDAENHNLKLVTPKKVKNLKDMSLFDISGGKN